MIKISLGFLLAVFSASPVQASAIGGSPQEGFNAYMNQVESRHTATELVRQYSVAQGMCRKFNEGTPIEIPKGLTESQRDLWLITLEAALETVCPPQAVRFPGIGSGDFGETDH